MKQLNNKQLWVLGYLRDNPGVSAQQIANDSPLKTVQYGNSEPFESPSLMYSHVYVVLQQLRKKGLVRRQCKRDEFGDELATHLYFPADQPDPEDPLEQAFAAPAAEGAQ